MRKSVILALVLVFVFSFASLASAAAPDIYINGTQLASDKPAVVENGRTLVPLRAIFEALGQPVNWNADERSITSGNLWLQLDNENAVVGETTIVLDVPAKLIDGSTYVPLRFIAESLGKDVKWVGDANRIEINDKGASTSKASPALDFELTKAYYEGGVLKATGIFTNTGNVEITKIFSMEIKIFLANNAGDSITACDDVYKDLALDIKPGEKVEYTLTTTCTTEYTDATKWWDESLPGSYEYIDIQ